MEKIMDRVPYNIIVDFDAISKDVFQQSNKLPIVKNMIRVLEKQGLRVIHYHYNKYVVVSKSFNRDLPVKVRADSNDIKQLVGQGGGRIRGFGKMHSITKVSLVDSKDYPSEHSEFVSYYLTNIKRISSGE